MHPRLHHDAKGGQRAPVHRGCVQNKANDMQSLCSKSRVLGSSGQLRFTLTTASWCMPCNLAHLAASAAENLLQTRTWTA